MVKDLFDEILAVEEDEAFLIDIQKKGFETCVDFVLASLNQQLADFYII